MTRGLVLCFPADVWQYICHFLELSPRTYHRLRQVCRQLSDYCASYLLYPLLDNYLCLLRWKMFSVVGPQYTRLRIVLPITPSSLFVSSEGEERKIAELVFAAGAHHLLFAELKAQIAANISQQITSELTSDIGIDQTWLLFPSDHCWAPLLSQFLLPVQCGSHKTETKTVSDVTQRAELSLLANYFSTQFLAGVVDPSSGEEAGKVNFTGEMMKEFVAQHIVLAGVMFDRFPLLPGFELHSDLLFGQLVQVGERGKRSIFVKSNDELESALERWAVRKKRGEKETKFAASSVTVFSQTIHRDLPLLGDQCKNCIVLFRCDDVAVPPSFLFCETSVARIQLIGLRNMTHIPKAFVAGSSVEVVQLDDLPELVEIGPSFCCNCSSISQVLLSHLPKLREIKGEFLGYTRGKRVINFSLERLPSLMYIGDGFFVQGSVSTLRLSHLPSLLSIGSNFCRESSVTMIDICCLPNLVDVGPKFVHLCKNVRVRLRDVGKGKENMQVGK